MSDLRHYIKALKIKMNSYKQLVPPLSEHTFQNVNSLIVFDVFPVKQVFSTWCVIPQVLNDPHIINSLPAALPVRSQWKKKNQQTSCKQPQSPCHIQPIAVLNAVQSDQRVLLVQEQVVTFFHSSMWVRMSVWTAVLTKLKAKQLVYSARGYASSSIRWAGIRTSKYSQVNYFFSGCNWNGLLGN